MAQETNPFQQVSPFDASTADNLLRELVFPDLLSPRGNTFSRRVPLNSHTGTWKTAINRLLMAGLRPEWEDRMFDTFCDHLFDVLAEQGFLRVPDTRTPMAEGPSKVPDSWRRTYNEDRTRSAREALRRTSETYRERRVGVEVRDLADAV